MKHTKGPWKLEEDSIWSKHRKIATIHSIAPGFGVDEKTPTANLIAAAPEMLDALEYALGVLVKMTVNAIDPNDFSSIRKECYEIQEHVVKKAKGES